MASNPNAPAGSRKPAGASTPGGVIATSFGGLIHSIQSGAADLDGIARQTVQAWVGEPDTTFTLEPTSLLVDGQAAIELKSKEGRWILPAFMAGLREIRIDEVGPEASDLLRLAEELAWLKPQADSVEAFRDWLWMDGAEGFACVCEDSFTDALDAAFVDPTTAKQQLLALRTEAAMSLSDASLAVMSRDIDAAAVREEFQLPLDALTDAARRHGFDVDEARRAELKRGCEDPAFWVKAQVDFAAANPALAPSLDPRKLAAQVVQILKHDVDLDLVAVLGELGQRKDPFAVALASIIEREPIGETIAASLRLNEVARPEVERLLSGERTRVSQGFAHGFMQRAGADRAALEAAIALVHHVSLKVFWKHIDLAKLTQPAQRGLVQVLPMCDPSPAVARDLLRNAKSGGPLLAAMPAAALMPLIGEVRGFLEKADHVNAEPVVDALVRSGDGSVIAMLGELALARDGGEWRKQTIEPLLKALMHEGKGEELVLPMAKGKKVPPSTRLVAYQALRANPELFERAIKRSISDSSEPPQIKSWLESVRGGGGGALKWALAIVAVLLLAGGGGALWYMKKENLDFAGLVARLKGAPPPVEETTAPIAVAPTTPPPSAAPAPGTPGNKAGSSAGKSQDSKNASGKSTETKPKPTPKPQKPPAGGN